VTDLRGAEQHGAVHVEPAPTAAAAASNAPPIGVHDDVSGLDAVSIYRAELSWLLSVLARLRVPDSDVEDAAHDVFVVLHRRLDTWDRTRPLRPWLFGIAVRVVAARKRRAFRRREQPMPEHFEPADQGLLVDEQVAANRRRLQAQRLVAIGLDALDDDKRAIFVLHELEGVAIVDCVAVLEAPLNTLYSRLRLARARFAAAVRAAGGDHAPR